MALPMKRMDVGLAPTVAWAPTEAPAGTVVAPGEALAGAVGASLAMVLAAAISVATVSPTVSKAAKTSRILLGSRGPLSFTATSLSLAARAANMLLPLPALMSTTETNALSEKLYTLQLLAAAARALGGLRQSWSGCRPW